MAPDYRGAMPTDPLPPPNLKRWTVRRKAAVLDALLQGRITDAEACARWDLTLEEIDAWQHALDLYGLYGLRATMTPRPRRRRPARRRGGAEFHDAAPHGAQASPRSNSVSTWTPVIAANGSTR